MRRNHQPQLLPLATEMLLLCCCQSWGWLWGKAENVVGSMSSPGTALHQGAGCGGCSPWPQGEEGGSAALEVWGFSCCCFCQGEKSRKAKVR